MLPAMMRSTNVYGFIYFLKILSFFVFDLLLRHAPVNSVSRTGSGRRTTVCETML